MNFGGVVKFSVKYESNGRLITINDCYFLMLIVDNMEMA